MAFQLEQVVPWGRSWDEYRRMFGLADGDWGQRILACADGPAGFNAESTRRGVAVTSMDPLYAFAGDEIQRRIDVTYERVLDETRRNAHEFVWREFSDVDALGRARREAMSTFLDDYELGRAQCRYVCAELPHLPASDHAFDLALCSHFLFLYSQIFTAEFHIASVLELCRVASEVRIFPLLALGGQPSWHVPPVMEILSQRGFDVRRVRVDYEFQRGGNEMLVVRARSR